MKRGNSLRWLIILPALFFALWPRLSLADPTPGLAYTVYNNWTWNNLYNAAPPIPPTTPVAATGTSPNIAYGWGGGPILGTNLTEDVVVRWTGWLLPPEDHTYYLCAASDDGFRLILDGVTVINDWYDRGGGCGQTADVDFTDGEPKELVAWYYENGGGAHATLLYYTGSGWAAVPNAWFWTDEPTPPTTTTTTEPATTTTEQTTTTTTTEPPTTTTTEPPTTSTVPTTTVPETTVPTTTTVPPTSSTTTTTTEPQTTTTSSSFTTTLPTTTTTTTTTTVYVPPATTTSTTTTEPPTTTTTTTVPETTTTLPPTTTIPPSTTVEPSTTTTHSSTTTVRTTVPPTTTVPETPTTQAPTTTASPPPATQPETTSPPQVTLPADPTPQQIAATIETVTVEQAAEVFAELQVEELDEEQVAALVVAVQNAPEEVREAFEEQVDIYKSGLDTYVPVGSKVPVSTRRTLIAVTAGTVLAAAGTRMRKP